MDLSLTVLMRCQTCGAHLSAHQGSQEGLPVLKVIPCQTCLNHADDTAWVKGYEKCWLELNGEKKVVA